MKALVVILLVAAVLALVLLAIILFRFGLRSYQRYSGLERQRGAAKQARTAGTDRLKSAESHLIDAERELAVRGENDLVCECGCQRWQTVCVMRLTDTRRSRPRIPCGRPRSASCRSETPKRSATRR